YDYFYYALAQGNDTSSYLTAYTGIVGDGAYLSNKIFWTLNGVTSYVEDITAYPTNVTVHYVANTALPSATAIASADVSTVGTSINIGEITILSVDDYGNANLLCSQSTTLSQTATIQSLSFYVSTAAGNLRLGIYDATGPGGGPGAKVAETNAIVPSVGWNTVPVITPISLPSGTYWIAYLTDNDGLHFCNTGSGTIDYYTYTYGALPATFSLTPSSVGGHWSFYATLDS